MILPILGKPMHGAEVLIFEVNKIHNYKVFNLCGLCCLDHHKVIQNTNKLVLKKSMTI